MNGFRILLSRRRYAVAAPILITTVAGFGVLTSEWTLAQDGESLEEIVVVGSAIGINEQEVESQALSIQLVTSEQLETSGQFTVGDLLRTQPTFSGSSSQTIGDGEGRQYLNMRGIGEQYTLSLLNGRRFSVNGPANVAAIPFEAIDRIEVLKSGASAIYGSDAVAGVVNFVLKDTYDGIGFSTSYGSAEDDYSIQDHSIYFGGAGESSRFFALFNYYENEGLLGVDRAVTASNDQRALGGRDSRSSFQNPARVIFDDGTELILNTDEFGLGEGSMDPADYRAYDFERDGHDRADWGTWALTPNTAVSAVLNTSIDLSSDAQLSADFLYNRWSTEVVFGTVTLFDEVPATNPYNPFGETVTVAWRPFGPPGIKGKGWTQTRDIDSTSASVQYSQSLLNDLTLGISANAFRETAHTEVDADYLFQGLSDGLARTGPNALNPFCIQCNSAEQFAGVIAGSQDELTSNLMEIDARIRGSMFQVASRDIQTNLGVTWREERFQSDPDQLLVDNLLADRGAQSKQNLDRTVTALFGEVQIPILPGDSGTDRPRVELGLAARYEDFSDFGETFDPLVSARAAITDAFTVRGSWNTSFRAPSLQDITANQVNSEVVLFDPEVGDFVEAIAVTGGNPDLEPEDAEQFNIGLVYQPPQLERLFFTVDWWNLEQTNVIAQPDPQAILLGEQPGTIRRGDDIGQGGEDLIVTAILTNIAGRELQGIDAIANYSTNFANEFTVDVRAALSYLLSFEADLLDGEGFQEQAGTRSSVFGGLPELKLVSGLTVARGAVAGTLEVSYVDSYEDPAFGPFPDPTSVDSVVYTDIFLQYEQDLAGGIAESVTLGLGVENLTDETPPFVRRSNFFDRSLHDIRGRYWFVNFKVAF